MPYSLPENPTREVVKREYTIVNMRFKEFLSLMEPEHREFVSKELGYVKDYVENKNGVRINHAEISLMFAKEVMSKYRNEETAVDILVAHKLQSGLRLRFLDLRETGSRLIKTLNFLDDAWYALDGVNSARPDTYTSAIDKVMYNLGEAEKLILEAEKEKLAEVGV